ncbi:magnesium-dependent phosphatase-1 [Cystobasidium minutum MCA 4210]|uniref:magnesium-dependent phosphatase-1 n=1 Tax=Cystobasidium minutum MCA 4210 TaxID=1397322 RepID=UPI0034CF0C20|eukprot:jgi/Rhomi1/32171/CE32170_706
MSDSDYDMNGNTASSFSNEENTATGSSGTANTLRMPKVIVFDLDYTLWPLWVDTHVSPPIKRKKAEDTNLVYDRYGESMSFYRDVPSILLELKDHPDVHVAIASRTSAPDAAAQALDQLLIPSEKKGKGKATLMRAMECFNTKEIYPGSKLRHFKEIQRKTKIAYEEMVFFDDESRNREVSSLGVTFVLVPQGVDRRIFDKGISDWRVARERAERDGSDSGEVFIERRSKNHTKKKL